MSIAQTPEPPYYAVIFSSVRTKINEDYLETAEWMENLAKEQVGFLGLEAAREELGITVSYWKDLASIKNWKNQMDHEQAQRKGRELWYQSYKTRIAKVERDYGFEREEKFK
jgi:heme-degrading monooxygenase HmoA